MVPNTYWSDGMGETFFFSNKDTYNPRALEHTNIHMISAAPGIKSLSVAVVSVLTLVVGFAAMLV